MPATVEDDSSDDESESDESDVADDIALVTEGTVADVSSNGGNKKKGKKRNTYKQMVGSFKLPKPLLGGSGDLISSCFEDL